MSEAPAVAEHPAALSPDSARDYRKRMLALGYRVLAARGWGEVGDGHISARDPERLDCFWMLRFGVSFHAARVADMVLVGRDGSLEEGQGGINVAGYYIHQPILAARPDAVSAVHVHTGWGTPFSAEVRPIEPISQESCVFFEDHSIFDDEEVQVQDVEGGRRIAAALGANRAIILRNHGLLTVGDCVEEAVGSFVHMERAAEVQMKTQHPKLISPEAARYARADLRRFGPGRIAFGALVGRHVEDPEDVLG